MKVYKLTKIAKDQSEVTVELTEAQFQLLESLVAENEDLFSDPVTEDKFCLEEPLQECFSNLYRKLFEVL